jgi:hypothetical protein
MSVCVYSVFVLSCVGSGLATGWSPVQGVLPTVYRIKKLIKRPGFKELYSHRDRDKLLKSASLCYILVIKYGHSSFSPLCNIPNVIMSNATQICLIQRFYTTSVQQINRFWVRNMNYEIKILFWENILDFATSHEDKFMREVLGIAINMLLMLNYST